MKKQFLFLAFLPLLLVLPACSFGGKRALNSLSGDKVELTVCEQLCEASTEKCLELSPKMCSKLCAGWISEQKECFQLATSCDDLYGRCELGEGFVFQQVEMDTPCSLACKNYVDVCDIQSVHPDNVRNQNSYDWCLEQCDDWGDQNVKCLQEATSCLDIMMGCGS